MFKSADFKQVLHIQERDSDGEFRTVHTVRGHIKVSNLVREKNYNRNDSPVVTHIFTTRFTGDITRGSRINCAGINFTIASAPEFLHDERNRYLQMRTYREESVEAIQSITAAGRKVTLLTPVEPTNGSPAWDPEMNGTTAPTETVITAQQSSFSDFEIDGTNVMATDIRYLVPGDVVINANMKIRDGNQTYDIIRVTPLRPGEETFLHLVQAR